MNKLQQLHWPLIIGMGALALLRPLMNIIGVMDGLGRPLGPLFVTGLISLVWLTIVVIFRVRQPLLTLIFTGMAYGVFSFGLGAIISPLLTGELFGPLVRPFILPFALVSVLTTNAIWGAVVGFLAWAIQEVVRLNHL
jgi:hypothetical protein